MLYFLLSTLVLTLYIDVVLSLSIKHIRVLQILDNLKIKANLNNILTWISQLEVWIVCQYVCDAQKHAHVHLK